MELTSLLAIFTAMILLAAIPGPAVLAVSACAVSYGLPRAGMLIMGITLGDYLYIILALFGLSALAQLLGDAFIYLKYVSAAYILYLGFSLITSKNQQSAISRVVANNKRTVFAGLLLNLSNPKAIIFYFGFFPAFIELQNTTVMDVLLIMLVATVAFASMNLFYASLAIKANSALGINKGSHRAKQVVGVFLVIIALWLGLADFVN